LATVKVPRGDRPRSPYTADKVRTMVRVLSSGSNRSKARDTAVVLMLLGCGLRLNELRELRLSNVHIVRPIEACYLLIEADTSKSKASRKVRLDPMAADAVHKYVEDWRPGRAEFPLFLKVEVSAIS